MQCTTCWLLRLLMYCLTLRTGCLPSSVQRRVITHSIVKHWLYLRMLWHCRGGDDRLVRSKIAAIEGIADKGPGVWQRWTRVKKGLSLMVMLLNARHTL